MLYWLVLSALISFIVAEMILPQQVIFSSERRLKHKSTSVKKAKFNCLWLSDAHYIIDRILYLLIVINILIVLLLVLNVLLYKYCLVSLQKLAFESLHLITDILLSNITICSSNTSAHLVKTSWQFLTQM